MTPLSPTPPHRTLSPFLLYQNPLQFFPYHTVMCWGHSRQTFQFRIFNKTGDSTTVQLVSTQVVHTERTFFLRESYLFFLSFLVLHQGEEIEQIVLKAVKSLMEDMEKKGVSDAEFKNLCSTVFLPPSRVLKTIAIHPTFPSYRFPEIHPQV
jgi:hypothetical protein